LQLSSAFNIGWWRAHWHFLGKIVKSDYGFHVYLFVCMQQLGSQWLYFHYIGYLSIFRKSVQKIQVPLNPTWIMGTLYEDLGILLRMRNVLDKICRESKTHNLWSIPFFPTFVPFMRKCGKIRYSQTSHRWHNTAHLFSCWITEARMQTQTHDI